MSTKQKPWQPEWEALKTYEATIRARFADPYGIDNYAYDHAKRDDPEWVRLSNAFLAARQAARA